MLLLLHVGNLALVIFGQLSLSAVAAAAPAATLCVWLCVCVLFSSQCALS